jgi:RNA polymerase sigma-70 factor (ECF subfamily)
VVRGLENPSTTVITRFCAGLGKCQSTKGAYAKNGNRGGGTWPCPVVRFARMSSAPSTGLETDRIVEEFCVECYGSSQAAEFGIELAALIEAVRMVVERWNGTAVGAELSQFLSSLKIQELVLTRACAAGNDAAWEHFLNRYRATLYSAAYKIAGDEATARELADSLYAELYGISESGRERGSKLLYYSGRGSLEGWLRTIVAREYVNRYRRTRRETSLDEAVEEGQQFASKPETPGSPGDERIERAIASEIAALDASERFLLASYYLDGRKLAEIARLLRVHESTVSRKLERATAALRKRIRKRLIDAGMSARQADEAMQDLDVRDVQLPIAKTLRQESQNSTFYKGSEP